MSVHCILMGVRLWTALVPPLFHSLSHHLYFTLLHSQLKQLMLCWGMTSESDLSTLPHRLSPNNTKFTHPELYKDALPEIKFFTLLSKLMTICGNSDGFGFKDLQHPTPKRLKKQLSAIINFLKFKEDMGCLIDQGTEEREELFAAMDEVTAQCASLEQDLESAQKIHQSKLLERDAALQECKEMEADIAAQNRKQASIRQETYILKKNANELKDQIANLNISLRELQAEERQLKKEVVDSPDVIKFELDNAQSQLDQVKSEINLKEQERKVLQIKLQNAMKAEGDVRRVMHLMEEMEGKVQEYEVVVEDVEDVQRRLDGAEGRVVERRKEMVGLEKKLEIVGKLFVVVGSIPVDLVLFTFISFIFLLQRVCFLQNNARQKHLNSSKRHSTNLKKKYNSPPTNLVLWKRIVPMDLHELKKVNNVYRNWNLVWRRKGRGLGRL